MRGEGGRVLLVTQTFHPQLGVGAIRATQLAALLPTHGWQVDVMTRPYGDHFDDTDTGGPGGRTRVRYLRKWRPTPLPYERSHGAIVPGVPSGPSARARAAFGRFRVRMRSVPDQSQQLWDADAGHIADLARELAPDVVLSTSPQHSAHRGGRVAAEASGAAWIVDFRDPLLGDPRYEPHGVQRVRMPAFRRFEAALYRDAAAVIHTIPSHHERSLARYAKINPRQFLVTNGFPGALLERIAHQPNDRRRFTVAGKVGPRVFADFVSALSRAVQNGLDAELVHLGELSDGVDVDRARRMLGDRYHVLGLVDHATAVHLIAEADVHLSLLDADRARAGLLSSKLFECAATGRPIVAVNPTADDRDFLARYPVATLLEAPPIDVLQRAITDAATKPWADLGWLERYRAEYSRDAQVATVARILDSVVSYGVSL